jgi:glucosylceramidase
MVKTYLIGFLFLLSFSVSAQKKMTWISTTQTAQWQTQKKIPPLSISTEKADVEVLLEKPLQTIEGFGTCFNELGWTSLALLKESDREKIMQELFAPNKGANFTICRMPVGANDFSTNWYSYNETDGDFDMKNFSISNDQKTLIPFIKNALKYNPKLKLWASPWSPPTWMKYNKHYASRAIPDVSTWPKEQLDKMRNDWGMDFKGITNGLKPEQEAKEGTDNFIQEEKYFKAYALYFSKFIEAYRSQNINIGMVMPQNEFNSDQVFPSCTWTAQGLTRFLNYLTPAMKAQNVDVFFGTMERANPKLVDTILMDSKINPPVKGVGFQWAGKGAITEIHKNYPNLKLYQSEQECGNGYNDWKYCNYAWGLMKHYLSNGTNAYMYWNTSLKEGGISTWGWHQNSLVTVDAASHTFKYNYEYYLIKHLSHFVKPNAKRLETNGDSSNILAFRNVDKSIVIMVQNETAQAKTFRIKIGNKTFAPTLEADSYNTFYLK